MTEKTELNVRLSDTTRIEAFSDGVFAIIITLLVLEIHRPAAVPGKLAQELLGNWPSYLAYLLAFLYVGIIWLNHHHLFQLIEKADITIGWTNLGGLGMTSLLPYPTSVMADAFRMGTLADERASVVLYAIVAGIMSLSWLPLFIYLSRHPKLLKPEIRGGSFAKEMSRPIIGGVSYAIAALLGWFVHPVLAIAVFVFMVIYHAFTCQGVRRKPS